MHGTSYSLKTKHRHGQHRRRIGGNSDSLDPGHPHLFHENVGGTRELDFTSDGAGGPYRGDILGVVLLRALDGMPVIDPSAVV